MKDFAQNSCRVALIQAGPVMFDKAATVERALALIEEAAGQGAQLIVFPESFIPCYPYGMTFGFTVGARKEEAREAWLRYYNNSVVVPGPEPQLLGDAAKKTGTYISIGITERDSVNATLYCTNLIFAPDGTLAAKHRKLKPTGAERVIWGDGYEGSFPVVDTPWGPMGSLICWENYMPLARAALYEKGISIYLAPNTNDYPQWLETIKHIAVEGRCFVINADQYFTKAMYPKDLASSHEIDVLPDEVCIGGSCIVDPRGCYVAEPVWNKEAILYADLDMSEVPKRRMEFDPVGHYARPDVLRLDIQAEA